VGRIIEDYAGERRVGERRAAKKVGGEGGEGGEGGGEGEEREEREKQDT
jgi:hypothetical protein